jgi:hypothetical protein
MRWQNWCSRVLGLWPVLPVRWPSISWRARLSEPGLSALSWATRLVGRVRAMPISLIFTALLALAPVITYAVMSARAKLAVYEAVRVERVAQRAVCDGRVAEVGRVHDRAVAEAASEALEAARAVSATPDSIAELTALCSRSASCRKGH